MSGSEKIDGLFKWADRPEWRAGLEATFERHVRAACRNAGLGPDDLVETLGADSVMAVWACAFEDFVSSRRGGRNVADDYLKRRGWKESAGARDYIEALRDSTVSLYEVSDIVVGESFLARDLARGGEPLRVIEHTATRTLRQWDRIAARIVTVRGKTQLTGALLPFPRPLADQALAMIEQARKKARAEAKKLARSLDPNMKGDALARLTDLDEVLAESAFLLSSLWLGDMLRRALAPSLPQMQNTDREPLEFVTIHFPRAPDAGPAAIATALNDIEALRRDSDSRWNWIRPNGPAGNPAKRSTEDGPDFDAEIEDGGLLLGHVELTTKAVTLSVNSEARGERGRAMLEPALAGLVRPPLVERQTVAQMMAAGRGQAAPRRQRVLPPEQERRLVHQALADHYRRILDEPIPRLGNQSPRAAAKTPKGRASVIDWLKELENHSARHGPDDLMSGYDFAWMWRELGLAEHRR